MIIDYASIRLTGIGKFPAAEVWKQHETAVVAANNIKMKSTTVNIKLARRMGLFWPFELKVV